MAVRTAGRPRGHGSPILSTAAAMISEASDTLVTRDSRFQHTFEAAMASIRPNPDQPRRQFADADIASLAATMAAQGQLQPVLLRRGEAFGEWVLVAGERRWRAARLNGWTTILAIEHAGDPEIVTLLENLQRVDLGPVEEAMALQRLIHGKGWTQDRAAKALGKSKGDVSGVLGILALPPAVLDAVLTSELTMSKHVLVELSRIPPGAVRDRLLAMARAGELTVRQIRAAAGRAKAKPRGGRRGGGATWAKLDAISDRLRKTRLTGAALSSSDRDRLLRLKREIDAWLDHAAGKGAAAAG